MEKMEMRKMTEKEKTKVMENIFFCMMQEGQFKDSIKMMEILKGLYELLESQEKLSQEDCDFCILCFFKNYSMGLKEPLTDSVIRETLIPTVRNFPTMDIAWAESWLIASLINRNNK